MSTVVALRTSFDKFFLFFFVLNFEVKFFMWAVFANRGGGACVSRWQLLVIVSWPVCVHPYHLDISSIPSVFSILSDRVFV